MQFQQILKRMVDSEGFAEMVSAEEVLASFHASFRTDRKMALSIPEPLVSLPRDTVPGVEWANGAFQLQNLDDAQKVIATARRKGRHVRVAGSRHSTPDAIYSESSKDYRVVLRDELQKITFLRKDKDEALFSVGAGCYLGVNPTDPLSDESNSLNHVLDAAGYALPVLGGISHQTVAGFMQTGSAGGSLAHGFADAIETIELVDGTGAVRAWSRGSNEFAAVGVSAGLFGIVTRVTLKVRPRYFVKGEETNLEQRDSVLVREPHGEYRLARALANDEYLHLNWFPQEGVERVTEWRGARTAPTSCPDEYVSALKSTWMNVVAAAVLWLTSMLVLIPVVRRIVAVLLNKFVPVPYVEPFNDRWLLTLPCDDQVKVDTLMRVIFTEIWLPMDQMTTAIDRLQQVLSTPIATGNFAVEFYGAKESPFWMSPSFGHEAVRVDVFWFAYSFGDPRKHFSRFWDALLELPGARMHWGKHLPDVGRQYGSVAFDLDLLRVRYRECDRWLALRSTFDPDNVFVTEHWGDIFELNY